MGIYNSSLKRVQPFFELLNHQDRSGSSWLPRLLALAPNTALAKGLISTLTGAVLPDLSIEFEKQIPPPESFLQWQIQNPDQLRWPKSALWGRETTTKREMLFGRRDLSAVPVERRVEVARLEQERTVADALSGLANCGGARSSKKWWAFEGFTSVDCFISTGRCCLYIEGKRTEELSRSIEWYPKRSQMLRNLESARAHAGGIPFGCLVISEQPIAAVSDAVIRESLPHLAPAGRLALMQNYLGNITWSDACKATGVDSKSLLETTSLVHRG